MNFFSLSLFNTEPNTSYLVLTLSSIYAPYYLFSLVLALSNSYPAPAHYTTEGKKNGGNVELLRHNMGTDEIQEYPPSDRAAAFLSIWPINMKERNDRHQGDTQTGTVTSQEVGLGWPYAIKNIF